MEGAASAGEADFIAVEASTVAGELIAEVADSAGAAAPLVAVVDIAEATPIVAAAFLTANQARVTSEPTVVHTMDSARRVA